MNKQPIEQAHDADLRFSSAALQRAALRARELGCEDWHGNCGEP